MKKIKYFKRYANINAETKAIKKVLKSQWLTTGNVVKEFEKLFAEKSGYKYAIAVNSATSGLLLSLQTSDLIEGSTVITTPYTFCATAHAIEQSGYHLKFVDIDDNTYSLNNINVYNNLDNNAACVLDVKLAGLDDNEMSIAGIKTIKDCAHCVPFDTNSINDRYSTRVYSFYANKNISCGEGGMICTNDENQVKKIITLMNHGIDRDAFSRFTGSTSKKWQYDIIESGYKFNMPDLIAAIGIEQLKILDKNIIKRRKVVNWYIKYLDLSKVKVQDDVQSYWYHYRHLMLVRVPEDRRDCIIQKLSKAGIETSVHYKPLHMMSYFKDKYGFKDEDFPNAYHNYLQTISLPIYPDLKKSEVKYICEKLNSLL